MRILLVEDEPRAAQLLAKGLRGQAAITEYDAVLRRLRAGTGVA
jgi:DNA-binding response OmpR family regulator